MSLGALGAARPASPAWNPRAQQAPPTCSGSVHIAGSLPALQPRTSELPLWPQFPHLLGGVWGVIVMPPHRHT